MPTLIDMHAQLMASFELQNGLSRIGSAHAPQNTLHIIANAFLAKNFVGDLFGRIGQHVQHAGTAELQRHRVPTLGMVRVHRRAPDSHPDTPLCEHILAAGGAEFCESREALLAGYLKRGAYLVLYPDVHVLPRPACADGGADGAGDTDGLLAHPETVEYAEFMQRMCENAVGWSAGFSQPCSFLPPDQGIPMRVEVVSWKDVELRPPEPPILAQRAGAPPHTRRLHMEWECAHFWTCLFQGSNIFQGSVERIRALYKIVLVDLFDKGVLARRECSALTGLELSIAHEQPAVRQQLLDAISTCQVAPMNVSERNYHTHVEAYDTDSKRFVALEPAQMLFPHARISHTRYNRGILEELAPGIYDELEPSPELCECMQDAVHELRAYLETAQASDDPDGPQVTFAGPVPLELYARKFQEMQAAAFDGSSCRMFTRFMLAYMRAWGYRARASVGSLTVHLPGREPTLLYGTGRAKPANLRDVWDQLVARHAFFFPERGVDVQRLLAEKIAVHDFMPKMYPEHLVRWARPTSHVLLPPVLPLRCEGCGCSAAKLLRCSRCRLVHYCSRACQLAQHATHGPVCRCVVRAVCEMLRVDAELVRGPAQEAAANRRPRC